MATVLGYCLCVMLKRCSDGVWVSCSSTLCVSHGGTPVLPLRAVADAELQFSLHPSTGPRFITPYTGIFQILSFKHWILLPSTHFSQLQPAYRIHKHLTLHPNFVLCIIQLFVLFCASIPKSGGSLRVPSLPSCWKKDKSPYEDLDNLVLMLLLNMQYWANYLSFQSLSNSIKKIIGFNQCLIFLRLFDEQ